MTRSLDNTYPNPQRVAAVQAPLYATNRSYSHQSDAIMNTLQLRHTQLAAMNPSSQPILALCRAARQYNRSATKGKAKPVSAHITAMTVGPRSLISTMGAMFANQKQCLETRAGNEGLRLREKAYLILHRGASYPHFSTDKRLGCP